MSSGVGVVWFRRDLRLADNPAWARATSDHERVAAVFVLDEVPLAGAGPRRVGLLVSHLRALHEDLVAAGGGLHLLRGRPAEEIPGFAAAVGASALHLNADVGAYARRRDDSVRRALDTVRFVSHWGNHVHPPGTVTASSTDAGTSPTSSQRATASVAATPKRVASTRSKATGVPPRWTWPRIVVRVSMPVRFSSSAATTWAMPPRRRWP